jgi:hypothetical protein
MWVKASALSGAWWWTRMNEKYAVEMQWQNVDFSAIVRFLGEHLEAFRKDEEEEGRGTMWYVS